MRVHLFMLSMVAGAFWAWPWGCFFLFGVWFACLGINAERDVPCFGLYPVYFGPRAGGRGGSWDGRLSRGLGPGLVFGSRGLGRLQEFRVMDLAATHLHRVVLLTGVLGSWHLSCAVRLLGGSRHSAVGGFGGSSF